MLSSLFVVPLLLAGTYALPGGWGPWKHGGTGGCLNDSQVTTLLDGYTYLLRFPQGDDFNKTANAILSDNFFVYSDSINSLAGIPLGAKAYPSKQAFIAGQAQTPPIPELATLGSFYDCNQIAWRWNGSSIGSNKFWVKGIITMDVSPATTQIDAVYSEFNTAAWLADIGNPECQQS